MKWSTNRLYKWSTINRLLVARNEGHVPQLDDDLTELSDKFAELLPSATGHESEFPLEVSSRSSVFTALGRLAQW